MFAEAGGRGLRVTACSHEAAELGASPGMPLAEARALLQRLPAKRPRKGITAAWKRADPATDRASLQQLALQCQQYSPFVGLEERPAPETLLFDIAGCAHLYGSEPGLLQAVTQHLTEKGFDIRTALADTIGVAWAVVHTGRSGTIVPAGQGEAALEPLPVSGLRIPADVVVALHRLDVRTVGDLQRLPRTALPSRFGKELLLRVDQALGHVWETFRPERFTAPPSVSWSADDPLSSQQGLAFVFRQLLNQLLPELLRQGAGILEARCELNTERETVMLPLLLSRPTIDARHLCQLFELGCERQAWPGGVYRFQLQIVRAGWMGAEQTTLFETSHSSADRHVTLLAERLSSRLGEPAVLRAERNPDPLPELSVQFVPWLAEHPHSRDVGRPNPLNVSARPWRMLPQPQPLGATSVVPDGPPLRLFSLGQAWNIARAWGPERIATGWWRRRDVQRDYYRVEIESGCHWWIFRQRDSGQWFLHGFFD